jgi:hypothetical protein
VSRQQQRLRLGELLPACQRLPEQPLGLGDDPRLRLAVLAALDHFAERLLHLVEPAQPQPQPALEPEDRRQRRRAPRQRPPQPGNISVGQGQGLGVPTRFEVKGGQVAAHLKGPDVVGPEGAADRRQEHLQFGHRLLRPTQSL